MTHDGSSSRRSSDKTTTDVAPISQSETKKRFPRVYVVFHHRIETRAVVLGEGDSVVVGRAFPSDVLIDDAGLSRQHARFLRNGRELIIEDLGSRNGTVVDGAKIRRTVVHGGQRITLSEVTAAVQWVFDDREAIRALDPYDRFCELLEYEIQRCRHVGRALSLLMLRAESVGEGLDLPGWIDGVRQCTRPLGRVALYDPHTLLAMLPEDDAQAARRIVESLEKQRGVPRLRSAFATSPDVGTTSEALIEKAKEALLRASVGSPVRAAEALRDASTGDLDHAVIESAETVNLYSIAARVAATDLPVLIVGETGTGKEILATSIHRSSPRRDRAFRAVNCAAIPGNLVESTLFGHERGAFTGASRTQPGLFEDASGGTIFLDEIGELGPGPQAALLRVLEMKTVTRVGGSKEIPVDVRVVAATHRDLDQMAREGTFRLDLLFRLNTMTLRVPPLRDRVAEIEPLAHRFLRAAKDRLSTRAEGLHPEALRLMQRYDWPGNVRELRNVIERACVLTTSDQISPDDLPDKIRRAGLRSTAERFAAEAPRVDWLDPDLAFKDRVRRYEEHLIVEGLRQSNWNQSRAAELLKIPLRTLVFKMRSYEIKKTFEPQAEEGGERRF